MHIIKLFAAIAAPTLYCLLVIPTLGFAEEVEATVSTEENLESENVESEEAEVADDKTVIVTANKYPTSIETVGSSVTVIDSEEIEKRKQPSVLELLRNVPGLEVSQTGGPGRTTSVFIRGAESDQTLVLIDGVRVNDNTTGQFNFANLKAENIERIEVLRGPQSVLYGSEAIGGVINVITRRGKDGLGASVFTEGGSHGTQHYRGAVSWGSEEAYSSTTASYLRTDGISAAASNRGNTEEDFYDNFSLSTRNGVTFLSDGTADTTFRYTSSKTELDDIDFTLGPIDALHAEQETDTLLASVAVSKPVTDWLTPSLTLGFSDSDSKGSDPDTEFNNFTIDNQTLSVDSKLDIEAPWGGVLSIGHNYDDREGENKGNFEENRYVNSFFALQQYDWAEQLYLTGGVRHDDDSDFGEETTFRTTLAWLLRNCGTRFHASYGTGFKAPTFNELFFPNFGNPDLEAETSWGYDVGVEQAFLEDKALLDITFFHSEIEDLITFDTDTFLAANIEKARAFGIESALSYDINEWVTSKASYTYTDSENKTTGGVLARRPRHRGSLSLFLSPIEKLETALTILLVNSRRDTNSAKMDNYERVDATFAYAVTKHLKPFVRAENLFDESYEEVTGFGTPGFSVFAGIEATL